MAAKCAVEVRAFQRKFWESNAKTRRDAEAQGSEGKLHPSEQIDSHFFCAFAPLR
jgi:hypothetical protein